MELIRVDERENIEDDVDTKCCFLCWWGGSQEEGNKKDIYVELNKNGKNAYKDIFEKIENVENRFYKFLWENFTEEELKFLYNFFVKINKFQNEEISKL